MATRRTMEWDTPLGRMLVTSPQILDQAKRFILLAVTNALAYFAQPSTKKKVFWGRHLSPKYKTFYGFNLQIFVISFTFVPAGILVPEPDWVCHLSGALLSGSPVRYQHSSLWWTFVNYCCKKLYKIDTRSSDGFVDSLVFVELPGEAEVGQLDVQVIVQQNVLRL